MNNELNKRQWALYNFIKKQGNKWTTQYDIASELYNYYGDCWVSDFHNSNARKIMTADIRAINNSGIIQKIIISGSKGIKLANKEEFDKFIKSEYASCFRKLARIRIKAKKAYSDQQFKIKFGDYERNVVEAFIEKEL